MTHQPHTTRHLLGLGFIPLPSFIPFPGGTFIFSLFFTETSKLGYLMISPSYYKTSQFYYYSTKIYSKLLYVKSVSGLIALESKLSTVIHE